MRTAPVKPWLLLALAAVYFAAGKLGLSFATLHSSASAVWPPTGIAIAAFLILGRGAWPAILLGAFAVNVTTAGTVLTSLGIAAGNTLEGLVAAVLVERFAGGRACFERAADAFRFFGLAAVAATAISATIGVATLALGGLAKWQDLEAIWLTWWLGDAAGALLVTPLVLLWHAPPRPLLLPAQRLEAVALVLGVMAVAMACFAAPVLRDYPLSFLCLPPLAWIAFRFGPREVATANVLVAAIAVVATETGLGSFVMGTRNESLLVLQAFMGMVAVTLLPMAALVREHREAVTEAEAATRARDVFLAMLSHELRNPLQAVAGSLHVLSGALPGPAAARAITIAHRQTEHLGRLLNDLLDVARAVSGKITLETRPVRLDEVVRHVIESLRQADRFGRRMVTLEAEPVVVDADGARMQQIAANLLSNAIKFTAPNGDIRVSVKREDGQAVLRVKDDGIGITPDLLPRVFELFTQGDRRLDRSDGGLGIGLTLVRTLALMHGGTSEAYSAGPDKGSELVVRFPRARAAAGDATQPVAKPAAAALAPRRLLLIEDNEDAREVLIAALAADGHEVHDAADGEAGIALARRVRPELVLIDIGLPGIDGYEVARRFRASEAGLGVRMQLIALTGYGQPEDVRRAMAAGFDRHLVKPVFPEALRAVLGGR